MKGNRRDFLKLSIAGGLGMILTACWVPDISVNPFAGSCILGRPTSDSVTISLLSSSDQIIQIEYGKVAGGDTIKTNPVLLPANTPRNFLLDQLEADTSYIYQVIVNGEAGELHAFQTCRVPGQTFVFTIDADPHNRDPNFSGELYTRTMTNALRDRPDFHINLGDTFMTEKIKQPSEEEVIATFVEMRPYFGILGQDVAVFLVNGNHEGELGWLIQGKNRLLPLWCVQARQLYYPNPTANSFYSGATGIDPLLDSPRDGYYAFTWGDALFVILDPFWYTTTKPQPEDLSNNWNWTLGKEQYNWFKKTLELSNSKYKFIFIHHLVGGNNTDARGGIEAAPYFEWGGKNVDKSDGFDLHRPGWGKPIHTLLIENRVSAVFHGHDHVYVHQELDGVVYQECPQPSITRYDNTQLSQNYGYLHGEVASSSGHLRVTVTPEQATVEYVRAYLSKDENTTRQNGQVDLTYTITPVSG